MKITADTNLLLRAAVRDNVAQAQLAAQELTHADRVAVPIPALCEFVWVLSNSYKRSRAEIAQSIRDLIGSSNVITDQDAVQAGLAFLDAGGDFADGIIVLQGRRLGGDEFVSFDRKAVDLARAQGLPARLLN